MQASTRKRLFFPMAIAAASLVALSASPASAASITINVASQAIPSGASCVYVTGITSGGSSGAVSFTAGGTARITNININSGESVDFDWRGANCSGSTIRDDRHTAPSNLANGGVWNIN